MTDDRQDRDKRPQNQAGEDKGPVKGVQVSDRQMPERDIPRGAEGDRQRNK